MTGDNEYNPKLVSQFLANYYDTFESDDRSSITKSQIISKYEVLFNRSKSFIDDLITHAEIFINIINPVGTSSIDRKLQVLTNLDASQAYPLLLYIFRSKYSSELLESILNTLINFFH